MSTRHEITCACGYTTLVGNVAPGKTLECFNCGAELDIDAVAVEGSSEPEAADSEPGKDSTGDAAPAPAAGQSPFEVEAGDISGAARARRPFEDDAPEEKEEAPRGPFTLEPAPEAGDSTFAQLMEAERPKDSGREIRVRTESALDRETGETCAECGRKIRGDWDRFRRPEGTICYVCSNQGTQGVPERVHTTVQPRMLSEEELLIDRRPPPAPPEVAWYLNPKSDVFQRVLLVLAFGTVLIAIVVNVFDIGGPSPEQLQAAREARVATTSEGEPEVHVPLFVRIVVWSWRIFAVYLGVFLTGYLVLSRDDRLPYDTLKGNVVYGCIVLLILTGIQAITLVLYYGLLEIYVAGAIWTMLLGAVSLLVNITVINKMLDYRVSDWAWSFLYFALTQTLIQSVGLFLYWGLYELFV